MPIVASCGLLLVVSCNLAMHSSKPLGLSATAPCPPSVSLHARQSERVHFWDFFPHTPCMYEEEHDYVSLDGGLLLIAVHVGLLFLINGLIHIHRLIDFPGGAHRLLFDGTLDGYIAFRLHR